MKIRNCFFILALALIFCGCASTNYKSFEGKETVFDGNGGTRSTIDGIDFWEYGDPPRKYKLMGIIEDERPGGIISMARLKGDIAKKAKELSADAVIMLGSGSKVRGYVTNASVSSTFNGNSAYSSGGAISAPVLRNNASFAVIKYID